MAETKGLLASPVTCLLWIAKMMAAKSITNDTITWDFGPAAILLNKYCCATKIKTTKTFFKELTFFACQPHSDCDCVQDLGRVASSLS